MPKILLREEEWYPVIDYSNEGYPVEVEEHEKLRIERAFEEFCEVQEFLKEKYKDAQRNKYEYK